MITPRKMFVTSQELDQLVGLGQELDCGRVDRSTFLDRVHELTGVPRGVLLGHRWTVITTDTVVQRCGRSVIRRGRRHETSYSRRQQRERIADQQGRAIESLKGGYGGENS